MSMDADTVYAKLRYERNYESPHGQQVAQELGEYALDVVDGIEWKWPWPWRGSPKPRWSRDDRYGFGVTMEYLLRASDAQTTLLVDGTNPAARDHAGVDLETHMGNVHAALPFTEGERHWLIHLFGDGGGDLDQPERSIRKAARETHPMVWSAGHRQPVVGQDLLNHWYAWRRDIFEFEGEGSREAACRALLGVGEILVPNAVELRAPA